MALPQRKLLPHTPPDFVPNGSLFFLTLCGEPRGHSQFVDAASWEIIRAAAAHYHAALRWYVRLLLAMPDHVHLLVSFPAENGMKRTVTAWKRFLAAQQGFVWQSNFFDHRLRNSVSSDEKAAYIRANPVRAGLAAKPEDWPYIWEPSDRLAHPW